MDARLSPPTPAARIVPPPPAATAFGAIRIEGGLFPAEFLQRVARQDAPGQSHADYALPPGRSLRDEIGRYWTIATALWAEYRRDQARTDIRPERAGIERWLVRLLRDVLGYSDLAPSPEPQIGDRRYPIRHRAHGGAVPLLLTTHDHPLDRSDRQFGDDGRRRAPHAAMQEFLNAEPAALWGIVANGTHLRLLRDNPSLTRPAYVEVDLERLFEEALYPDFAALFLIAHASRTAPGAEGMAGCWLERWRAEGARTGQRALERLRTGVTTALRELGCGFIEHPGNDPLRAALRDGSVAADTLHQQLLRLVYRLLFLFTAEERDLLHPPDAAAGARALYSRGYGLGRLRERARRRRHYDAHGDLWLGLSITFRGLARGAPPLGLPALGGLFDPDQCPLLDDAALANARLLAAIHALAWFEDRGSLARVNYRDMGTEELGSVYESLLELRPVVQVAARPWRFAFAGDEAGGAAKGSERKLSGSYYTPDSLVQELLRSALDPVIEAAQRNHPSDPKGALLGLRVLDPACGSGHFLLGAARRLADAVARLEMEEGVPDEAVRRRCLREVVRRCIFGVDRNPLSVELCRTALWIEAIEPGKPLSFLDAHIKCGDSLVGVFDLSVLKSGIPDAAFKELTGDDKAYARDLRKRNKAERETPDLALLPQVALPRELAAALSALSEAPEDSLAAVAAKRAEFARLNAGRAGHDLRVACDLWCAAFFAPRRARPELRGRDLVPTTDTVWRYLRNPSGVYGPLVGATEELRGRLRFFHWPLEFADVFAAGGFDCVLGNPPWEVMQLGEEEYFATRHPAIAALPGARRKAAINALEQTEPALWDAYRDDLHQVEATNRFIRGSGRFPLTAVGKLNSYSLFAEAFLRLPAAGGRAGLIVPTGIATDDSNKAFFEEVAGKARLASLYDFENREGLFPEVHRSYKFALLTLGAGAAAARFVFFATSAEQLADARRAFTLSADDFRLINPNTRTCPVFRSSADAELTKRIYARVPVLIREIGVREESAWGATVIQNFFSTSNPRDQKVFVYDAERDPTDLGLVAVRRGSMIWQFDHQATVFEPSLGKFREASPSDRSQPGIIRADKYAPVVEVQSRLAQRGWKRRWLMGWRDICRATDERTVIASVLPLTATDDTLSILLPTASTAPPTACLLGSLNSLVVDFVAQQKVGGIHVRKYVIAQLPALPPDTYTPLVIAFLLPRILELTYTAEDMRPWAEDLGYTGPPFRWDEARRAFLRAELDAAYAHLYGLSRDELRYILDPSDIYGPDFPSETFRVLKEKEIRQHGEYRTARLVLAAWDRLTTDGTFASWVN